MNDIKKEETSTDKNQNVKRPNRINPGVTKWIKWLITLSVIGLIIWGIWYVSVPHYSNVQPSSISYDKDKKKINVAVNNKTYTADPDSVSTQYYAELGSSTVYKFLMNTSEIGQIAFNASVIINVGTITVDGSSQLEAIRYAIMFNGSKESSPTYKFAINNNKNYIWDDTKQCYVSADDANNTLVNIYKNSIINAAIPSSTNLGTIVLQFLPNLLLIGLFVWFYLRLSKLQGGGEESIWSVGKSQAKLARSNVKFDDVAGLVEEKAELIELVDYLKNPNKYAAMGARAPKGLILYGPPGTGKTLLAKAVAGEAKVPFYQVTGSSFEDMLVGVGAKRVRDLFNNAKKTAPSIIFIDEFDSVAAKRGKFDIAGNSAGIADQTINQLLAEMDGFNTDAGIVIIAATNRLDVLDEAILRPGRFDRHIQVNLPDIKEREAILKIHAKNKNISAKVNLNDIARRTPGFSGAQLENVLNEATLLAVRNNKTSISTEDIDEAIDRVIAGPAKHTRVLTEDETKQIAYHEAGHALVGLNIPGSDVVEKITIIPRGQAAGYTLSTPEKQEIQIQKKSDLIGMITTTFGGRAAEEVIYGKEAISTGAANDLYKITNIARAMVAQLGMSELGMTQFIPTEGQQNPYSKSYSEQTAQKIDAEINKLLTNCYEKAKDIIRKNKEELDLIVTSLLVLETIVKSQIDYIHENKKLPAEVIEKQKQISTDSKTSIKKNKK